MKEKRDKRQELPAEWTESYARAPWWLLTSPVLSHPEARCLLTLVRLLGGRKQPMRISYEMLASASNTSTATTQRVIQRAVREGWLHASKHVWPTYRIDLAKIASDLHPAEPIEEWQPRTTRKLKAVAAVKPVSILGNLGEGFIEEVAEWAQDYTLKPRDLGALANAWGIRFANVQTSGPEVMEELERRGGLLALINEARRTTGKPERRPKRKGGWGSRYERQQAMEDLNLSGIIGED